MLKKALRWILGLALTEGEPLLAKVIDSDKAELLRILQESDGKNLAAYICSKIREALNA